MGAKAFPKGCAGLGTASFVLLGSGHGAARLTLLLAAAGALLWAPGSPAVLLRSLLLLHVCVRMCPLPVAEPASLRLSTNVQQVTIIIATDIPLPVLCASPICCTPP